MSHGDSKPLPPVLNRNEWALILALLAGIKHADAQSARLKVHNSLAEGYGING